MNDKTKEQHTAKARTRATYTFEEAKQLLNAIAEVYEGMLSEKIQDGTAKARGYILQVAGGLYRNCEIERRMDKLELEHHSGQVHLIQQPSTLIKMNVRDNPGK